MPDALHTRVQRELFVRSFFDVAPPGELVELLAEEMRDRVFESGDVIYARGQPSGRVFFITLGTVELSAPDSEPWVLEDRALIGAIDANNGEPHERTARAKTRVRAIEVHFDAYLTLLEDYFDFAKDSLIEGARRTHQFALDLAPDGLYPAPRPGASDRMNPRRDDIQKLVALRATRAWGGAPVQPLVTLARTAYELRFSAGDTIFRADTPSEGLHVLIDGLIEIHHSEPLVRCLVGSGEVVFGVFGIVPGTYPFSAVARTDLALLRLAHEDIFDAMEEHFGLTRSWWVYMGRENTRIRHARAARGLLGDAHRSFA